MVQQKKQAPTLLISLTPFLYNKKIKFVLLFDDMASRQNDPAPKSMDKLLKFEKSFLQIVQLILKCFFPQLFTQNVEAPNQNVS
jgi:hypothetical protein